MKSLAALTLAVLGTFAPAAALAAEAAKPAPKPVAKPAATEKAAEPKKKTLVEPVTGILLARKDGGFVNLYVENNNFRATFWNAKKEEMAPDATRVIVRFRRFGRDQRFVLTPASDGKAVTSSFNVERPYRFTALSVLLYQGGEEPAETFNQLFYQPMPGDGDGTSADAMTDAQAQKVK